MNNYQRPKVRIVRMNGCFGKPSYILLLDNNIQKWGLSALSALETAISLFLFLSSWNASAGLVEKSISAPMALHKS